MSNEVGSFDAKTKLPEMLRQVKAGQAFTITDHGKPMADLVPSRADQSIKARSAIDNILNAKKHIVTDEDLSTLKNEGRK